MAHVTQAPDLTETIGVSIPYNGSAVDSDLLDLAKRFSASVHGPYYGSDSAHYVVTVPDAGGPDFRQFVRKKSMYPTKHV